MDRVRVGLTGLGAVFLLTLGVSLVFGGSDKPPATVEAEKEPGEPLAQLGVAPSNEKAGPSADAPAQAPDAPAGDAAVQPPAEESPVRVTPEALPAADAPVAI